MAESSEKNSASLYGHVNATHSKSLGRVGALSINKEKSYVPGVRAGLILLVLEIVEPVSIILKCKNVPFSAIYSESSVASVEILEAHGSNQPKKVWRMEP